MTDTLLDGYPVVVELPVVWGEMDAFQHVNNVVYFRYFETVRIAYFRKLDFMKTMEEPGIGPILAETRCRFKIPLTYPDTVFAGARVTAIGADRFTMVYRVVSEQHQGIAAEGNGELVTFNYLEGKKTSVPDLLRQRILELETLPVEESAAP